MEVVRVSCPGFVRFCLPLSLWCTGEVIGFVCLFLFVCMEGLKFVCLLFLVCVCAYVYGVVGLVCSVYLHLFVCIFLFFFAFYEH